jgi:outer membrane protein assembly factor BamA
MDTGRFSFQAMQLEGVQYIPAVKDRWTFALRAWGAFTNTSVGDGHVVPFYLMPNTGGRSTVRGFRDFRFYGPQMAVVSAESRWAIFEHLDAAVFVDAGRVADRVADLGISGFKTSTGAGIRFHTRRDTIARVDVARSNEGWVLIFKTNEPFTRKVFSGKRGPTVPFVP